MKDWSRLEEKNKPMEENMSFENDEIDIVDEDEAMLRDAKNGDLEALEAIFTKYSIMVKSKARLYFLSGGDSDDLIQEGMIGLFKAVRDYKFERVNTFKNFAELCVTRQMITAVRRYSSQKHMPLNSYVSLNRPINEDESENTILEILYTGSLDDPEELLISKEQYKIFNDEITQILSGFEGSVLEMYLSGMSYDEIALSLDKDYKAIDNALQRIKKKVSNYLSEKHRSHKIIG